MKAESGLTPGGASAAGLSEAATGGCDAENDGWGGGGVVNGGGIGGARELDEAWDVSRYARFKSSMSLTPILLSMS